ANAIQAFLPVRHLVDGDGPGATDTGKERGRRAGVIAGEVGACHRALIAASASSLVINRRPGQATHAILVENFEHGGLVRRKKNLQLPARIILIVVHMNATGSLELRLKIADVPTVVDGPDFRASEA